MLLLALTAYPIAQFKLFWQLRSILFLSIVYDVSHKKRLDIINWRLDVVVLSIVGYNF